MVSVIRQLSPYVPRDSDTHTTHCSEFLPPGKSAKERHYPGLCKSTEQIWHRVQQYFDWFTDGDNLLTVGVKSEHLRSFIALLTAPSQTTNWFEAACFKRPDHRQNAIFLLIYLRFGWPQKYHWVERWWSKLIWQERLLFWSTIIQCSKRILFKLKEWLHLSTNYSVILLIQIIKFKFKELTIPACLLKLTFCVLESTALIISLKLEQN